MSDENTIDWPIVPEEKRDTSRPKSAANVTVTLNPDAPPGPPPKQKTQDVGERIESDPIVGALDMSDVMGQPRVTSEQEEPREPEEYPKVDYDYEASLAPTAEEAEKIYGLGISKEGRYQDFEPFADQSATTEGEAEPREKKRTWFEEGSEALSEGLHTLDEKLSDLSSSDKAGIALGAMATGAAVTEWWAKLSKLPLPVMNQYIDRLQTAKSFFETGENIYHLGERFGQGAGELSHDFDIHGFQRSYMVDRLKEFYEENKESIKANAADALALTAILASLALENPSLTAGMAAWLKGKGFFKKNPGLAKDLHDAQNPGAGEVAVPSRQDENGAWHPKTFVSQEQQEININSAMNGQHPYGEKYERMAVDEVEPAMQFQREYNGINDTVSRLSKLRAPYVSPWVKNNSQKSVPEVKPPAKLGLFDMIDEHGDNFQVTDISRFFKIEKTQVPSDIEGGEPTYAMGFDQNMPIRSEQGLEKVVVDAHSHYMEKALGTDPVKGDIDYLHSQLFSISDRQQQAIDNDYVLLFNGVENKKKLEIEFAALESDPTTSNKLNADIIDYREGHKPFPVADYSRDMFTYAQNSKKLFKRSSERFQERGVVLNTIENYSPHAKDIRLLGNMSPEQFSELERPIRDWEAMGLGDLTEAEQKEYLKGEWEHLQATLGSLSSGGFTPRAGFLKTRNVKYKPGGWAKVNQAYGKYKHIRNHDIDYIRSSNSSLAMNEVFTQDGQGIWNKLRVKLIDHPKHKDPKREDALTQLDSLAHDIFTRDPVMNFESGLWLPFANTLTSAVKTFSTRNSALYSIIQDPIMMAWRKLGLMKDSKARFGGEQPSSGILGWFAGPEFKDQMALRKIIRGRLHAIDLARTRELPARGLGSRAARAGELGLKKLANTIRIWSGQNYFSELRSTDASFTYQSAVTRYAKDRIIWSSLNRNFRSYLREAGMTSKEWHMFIDDIYPAYKREHYVYSDMLRPISKLTREYVEFTHIMESDNSLYRNIAQKLQRAQLNYVHGTVIESRPHTVYRYSGTKLGRAAKRLGAWGSVLLESMTRFRGYKMELWNLGRQKQRQRQYYGAKGSTNFLRIMGEYWVYEAISAILIVLVRELFKGKVPDLDNPEEFLKLSVGAFVRGIPVPWVDDLLVGAYDAYTSDKEFSRWATPEALGKEMLPFLAVALMTKGKEFKGILDAETPLEQYEAWKKFAGINVWYGDIPIRWLANEAYNRFSAKPKYNWDEQAEKARKKGFTYFVPPLFPGTNHPENR